MREIAFVIETFRRILIGSILHLGDIIYLFVACIAKIQFLQFILIRFFPYDNPIFTDRSRNNKEFNILAVKYDPKNFLKISEKYQNFEIIVKEALKRDGMLLEFMTDRFKKRIDIAKIAISKNREAYYYVDKKLKSNKELFEFALNSKNISCSAGLIYDELSSKLKNDKEIAILSVSKYDELYEKLPTHLQEDRDVYIELLKCIMRKRKRILKEPKPTRIRYRKVPKNLEYNIEIIKIIVECELPTKILSKYWRNKLSYFEETKEKIKYLDCFISKGCTKKIELYDLKINFF